MFKSKEKGGDCNWSSSIWSELWNLG